MPRTARKNSIAVCSKSSMRSCAAITTFFIATMSAPSRPEGLAELATGTIAKLRLDHDGAVEDPLQARGRVLVVVDVADRCRDLTSRTTAELFEERVASGLVQRLENVVSGHEFDRPGIDLGNLALEVFRHLQLLLRPTMKRQFPHQAVDDL